jgi:hypothetical protein
MNVAFIHQDNTSRLYYGEIKNENDKTIFYKITRIYPEMITWAKENEARIINLDRIEDLED